MKIEKKWEAINLRRKGYSYSKIRQNIKVSKSTLTRWLHDIILTPKQQKQLLKGLEILRYASAQSKKAKKKLQIKKLTEEGKNEFPKLLNNPLFLAGLMLYWAEGDKNQNERVKFTNSDKTTIILMMKWFREICNVSEKKFRIALHIHNLYFRKNPKKYWSKLTNIPLNQFHKVFVKPSSLKQRRNILYNGTCAIVICDKNLFRRIMGWKLGLLDYFKINTILLNK